MAKYIIVCEREKKRLQARKDIKNLSLKPTDKNQFINT